MKTYLISVIGAALVASIACILSPKGEKGGIEKHVRLLTSLLLVAVLISPVYGAIRSLTENAEDLFDTVEEIGESGTAGDILQGALDTSSKAYFTEMLTETLETEFSIAPGEVRCVVKWNDEGTRSTPTLITVILSGRAKWKDPQKIEDRVSALLGCECRTAIE